MGINFRMQPSDTRSRASWSYSGFGEFRNELASLVGIELHAMEGFGGELPWSSVKPDAINILLDHSDCDGKLTAEECRAIAPRLLELAPQLKDGYDTRMAITLSTDMALCASRGEVLEFC
jgi:hypothetical protein